MANPRDYIRTSRLRITEQLISVNTNCIRSEEPSCARVAYYFFYTGLFLRLLRLSEIMGGFGKPIPAYTTHIAGHWSDKRKVLK